MKTFADVKRRFKVGTMLLCVENTYRPDVNGTRRRIEKVQTNALACSLPDEEPRADGQHYWTYFPASAKSVVVLDADTFRMPLDRVGQHHVTLRFLPEAGAP